VCVFVVFCKRVCCTPIGRCLNACSMLLVMCLRANFKAYSVSHALECLMIVQANSNMDTMRIGTPEYMGPELISSR
jgi:hypothetical protein